MDEHPTSGKLVAVGTFDYRRQLKDVIMTGPPAQPERGIAGGLKSDEIIQSVLTYGKIREAVARGEDFVLLDRECYDYLIVRLNSYRWNMANECVQEFIRHIREAKEEEFEVVPKPAAVPEVVPTPRPAN